jgi:hypothetical protein
MKKKVLNAFIKAIGFAGSLLLTIFAGIFAMISLSALIVSIIEKDFYSVIACLASGVIAWVLWDVRKDTLV